ncbi:hypothetical protein [Candidatus Electronema sp. PJ]|uniref:hypothetical protein n=1 Tax=Candidatus Electronema sp. PJ TaxID=3401572 RepID=UPI003AA99D42
MRYSRLTSRTILQQVGLSFLCLFVPAQAAPASVLKMIIPVLASEKQIPPPPALTWGSPQRLESNTGFIWSTVQLTGDAAGNAFVTWAQQAQPDTVMRVWLNRYSVGSGWQVAQTIDANTGYNAYTPYLTIDPTATHAGLGWREENASGYYDLYTRFYTAANGWTEPVIIQDQVSAVSSPIVSVDPAGNAMTAWHEGYKPAILKARRYGAGSGWETTQVLVSNSTDISDINLGMDTQGNALLVWAFKPMYTYFVMASCYQSGVGWTEPQLIEPVTWPQYTNSTDIQLVMLPSGAAMVVWTREDKIWLNSYEPGNGWGTGQPITSDVGTPGYPDVASNEAGHKVVVWQQFDGTYQSIWAKYYLPGSGWSLARLIEKNTTGNAQRPKVAINATGTAVVVWQQDNSGQTSVWTNHYVPGTGWSLAQAIDPANTSGTVAQSPLVTINTEGHALAVWRNEQTIWAARSQ